MTANIAALEVLIFIDTVFSKMTDLFSGFQVVLCQSALEAAASVGMSPVQELLRYL